MEENLAMDAAERAGALEPPLRDWAERFEGMEWSALILDGRWNLQWVSTTLLNFLGVDSSADLGYERNLLEAWTSRAAWLNSATPESQIELFFELAPIALKAMGDLGVDAKEALGEQFRPLVDQIELAAEAPQFWSSSFEYNDPKDPQLPTYRVNFCSVGMNDSDGASLGLIFIFFIDVNPNLMTLLVRGDQSMHARMARLVDPQPQQAVIVFCDLHESGRLSRELSSTAYFKLVRRLWMGIDGAIASESGIVGKHAGDGASAFFLAEDLGSPSAAAAAAIRAARRIHETSAEVFREAVGSECLMKVGLHWGGSLFMGQLVPGGRLDVTALGDEVNEAARVQECADPGSTLATKQLLERLDPEAAASVGVDLEKTRFTVLSERAELSGKVLRDAGTLAVTELSWG
jgi:class 3 adenylate cyclase